MLKNPTMLYRAQMETEPWSADGRPDGEISIIDSIGNVVVQSVGDIFFSELLAMTPTLLRHIEHLHDFNVLDAWPRFRFVVNEYITGEYHIGYYYAVQEAINGDGEQPQPLCIGGSNDMGKYVIPVRAVNDETVARMCQFVLNNTKHIIKLQQATSEKEVGASTDNLISNFAAFKSLLKIED